VNPHSRLGDLLPLMVKSTGLGDYRLRGIVLRLLTPGLPLARFHVHFPSAESHAFSFQPQPLFDCRIARELNLTPCSQDALPRQPESAAKYPRNHPRRTGIPRHLRDSAVSRNPSLWNGPYSTLDAQQHGARITRFCLSSGELTALWFQTDSSQKIAKCRKRRRRPISRGFCARELGIL
jgi:hypothetical protein